MTLTKEEACNEVRKYHRSMQCPINGSRLVDPGRTASAWDAADASSPHWLGCNSPYYHLLCAYHGWSHVSLKPSGPGFTAHCASCGPDGDSSLLFGLIDRGGRCFT